MARTGPHCSSVTGIGLPLLHDSREAVAAALGSAASIAQAAIASARDPAVSLVQLTAGKNPPLEYGVPAEPFEERRARRACWGIRWRSAIELRSERAGALAEAVGAVFPDADV